MLLKNREAIKASLIPATFLNYMLQLMRVFEAIVRELGTQVQFCSGTFLFKNWFMLSVHISSYGCTREVWRAREKRKSCSRRSLEQL